MARTHRYVPKAAHGDSYRAMLSEKKHRKNTSKKRNRREAKLDTRSYA